MGSLYERARMPTGAVHVCEFIRDTLEGRPVQKTEVTTPHAAIFYHAGGPVPTQLLAQQKALGEGAGTPPIADPDATAVPTTPKENPLAGLYSGGDDRGTEDRLRKTYPKGQDITDAQMVTLNLVPHRFHGGWNSTIDPMSGRR